MEADVHTVDMVDLGTTVKLLDLEAEEMLEFVVVRSMDAGTSAHKISSDSPVGRAILGRRKGETVEVAAPRGSLRFAILEVKSR